MVIKLQDLPALRRKFRDKKIVFAGGTFDLFHRGHVDALKNLRKYGDMVVIAVSTDKRVRQRKGPKRPILSQKDRLFLVDAVRYVDYALIAPEPSKNKPVPTVRILERLRPDVFITIDKRMGLYRKNIENLGVKLKIIPRVKVDSSSRIINKILKRYRK